MIGGDCVELRQKILGNCCVNRISHKSQARLKLSPFHFHSKPWTGGGQIGRLVREQSLTCVCKSCAHLLLNKKPSWLKAGDSSIGLPPPYQQSNFPCSNRSNISPITPCLRQGTSAQVRLTIHTRRPPPEPSISIANGAFS